MSYQKSPQVSEALPLPRLDGRVAHGNRPSIRLVSSRSDVDLNETSDGYLRVLCRDDNVRLIECRNQIQWILQVRDKAQWRSKAFATSRAGLLRSVYPDGHQKKFEGWWISSSKLHDFIRWLPDRFRAGRFSSG